MFEEVIMLKEIIGKRIRDLRITKIDMSQEEFCNKLGLDRTYLSRLESGKQNITISKLNQICNGLQTSLKDFFDTFDEIIVESEKELNE